MGAVFWVVGMTVLGIDILAFIGFRIWLYVYKKRTKEILEHIYEE